MHTQKGEIHYWISRHPDKNAKTLVLTHGIATDNRMFEKQVSYFKDLYTIITWDTPRHGLSINYKDFSYNNNAKLLKSILDREKIKRVIHVGMSNGGYTCQEFCHLYESYVEGFLAIDTTPFGRYYSKLDKLVFSLFASSIYLIPEKYLYHTMAKSSCKSRYAYNLMKTMQSQYSKKEIIYLVDIAYKNLMKENKDVSFKFPVWILLGQYDSSLKVDKYSYKWSRSSGYPIKIIPDAGHFSNADNYIETNKIIKSFIDTLASN